MLLNSHSIPKIGPAQEISMLDRPLRKHTESEKRIIVKKGREFLVFRYEDIAYFFIENGVSYLVEKASQAKYISSRPLSAIEANIDSKDFFRVSKKYLVNIRSVIKFKPAKGGKLELMINPAPEEAIIISQLKAKAFKNWILQS